MNRASFLSRQPEKSSCFILNYLANFRLLMPEVVVCKKEKEATAIYVRASLKTYIGFDPIPIVIGIGFSLTSNLGFQ